MHKLHPGAQWLFRVRAYVLLLILSWFTGGFIIPAVKIVFSIINNDPSTISLSFALLSLFSSLVIIIIIGEVYSRMAYNRWFYEFTKEGLKLERGIIWKRYSNVPYERIQNVDIKRGILARLLGFSSIMIQTAGYSAQTYAEGYIPALDMKEAEKIRNFIMKKISRKSSRGL
ncbi:MAG TPA: PH domain-containing protein [Candidatus Nanoarchaeia archaeon]|nr:PH domain-containing protein [Candidatus Nanoarchaeia archaeon]